jgi:hypothetical protein
MPTVSRFVRSASQIDLNATLGSLGRGPRDPAFHTSGHEVWWATHTPDGVGTVQLRSVPGSGGVAAQTWGPGSTWLLDQVPDLLGARDDCTGFAPQEGVIAQAWRRHQHWRVPRTSRVFEACVAAVIEQKVTGREAYLAWRQLLRSHGEVAPGPTPVPMHAPPSPAVWRHIPQWDYRRAGVTPQRVRGLLTIASAAPALERLATVGGAEADRVLQQLPGVGGWTSAETRQRALGDADAVSVGDFHLAKDLCWWLTGERGDDARMLELLAPYAGHRYRVQRLMELVGVSAPRRGPRFAPPEHRSF